MKPPSHRDYEPFELATNMEEDLGLFEAATHAPRVRLEEPRVGTVLVAAPADAGSPRAVEACRSLGHAIAARLGAAVMEDTVIEDMAKRRVSSAEDLRQAVERTGAGLVVTAVELLGDEISGRLLAEGPGPVLCLGRHRRRPPPGRARDRARHGMLDAPLLPLIDDTPASRRATAWACRLAAAAGTAGRLRAIELAGPRARAAARGRTGDQGDVGDAVVGRIVSGRLGAVVAALQRDASARGFTAEVEFRVGGPAAVLRAVADTMPEPPLIVIGRDQAERAGRDAAANLAVVLLAGPIGGVLVV